MLQRPLFQQGTCSPIRIYREYSSFFARLLKWLSSSTSHLQFLNSSIPCHLELPFNYQNNCQTIIQLQSLFSKISNENFDGLGLDWNRWEIWDMDLKFWWKLEIYLGYKGEKNDLKILPHNNPLLHLHYYLTQVPQNRILPENPHNSAHHHKLGILGVDTWHRKSENPRW